MPAYTFAIRIEMHLIDIFKERLKLGLYVHYCQTACVRLCTGQFVPYFIWKNCLDKNEVLLLCSYLSQLPDLEFNP
jgi:hypothetical protein